MRASNLRCSSMFPSKFDKHTLKADKIGQNDIADQLMKAESSCSVCYVS